MHVYMSVSVFVHLWRQTQIFPVKVRHEFVNVSIWNQWKSKNKEILFHFSKTCQHLHSNVWSKRISENFPCLQSGISGKKNKQKSLQFVLQFEMSWKKKKKNWNPFLAWDMNTCCLIMLGFGELYKIWKNILHFKLKSF